MPNTIYPMYRTYTTASSATVMYDVHQLHPISNLEAIGESPFVTPTNDWAKDLEYKIEQLAISMVQEKNLVNLGLKSTGQPLLVAIKKCLLEPRRIDACFYWNTLENYVQRKTGLQINCSNYCSGHDTHKAMVLTMLFKEIVKHTPPLDLSVWSG